jgi:membrane protein implicated in regulation of membrane protease activity
MSDFTWWWLLAGAMVGLEMLTGTFYLLMLALGLAAGALAAHLGAGLNAQIATAAVVGCVAVVLLHLRKLKAARAEPPASANPAINLDIGETVQVGHWDADGTARVHYRGTSWTAVHRAGVVPSTGAHRVAEIIGSRLLLDHV